MAANKQKLEREFFRMLNRVVEPAVRKIVLFTRCLAHHNDTSFLE
ncbi:MAG: hypothetical protein V7709_08170 [Halioglobus sp.]